MIDGVTTAHATFRSVGAVKAVLLDSGGVLIRPVGGRWNPRFDFEQTVLRVAPHLAEDDFRRAIVVGHAFLETAPADTPRDDYHRAMLDELGIPAGEALLAQLDQPLDPATVVEPYPEVLTVLDELRGRGVRLAVVSDASPNLPELHEGVGLGGFFEAYAISSVLGCTKPDPRLYRHASEALGLGAERCLFVDDRPELVAAALDLGYRGVVVTRDGAGQPRGMRSVPDLSGLLRLV